jgi:hypothetical protein
LRWSSAVDRYKTVESDERPSAVHAWLGLARFVLALDVDLSFPRSSARPSPD